MPKTDLIFYAADARAPVMEWLKELRHRNPEAYIQCFVRIKQLAAAGHELRRPVADFLRDEIYELRAKKGHVQYRILYFFHGKNIAILAHAMIKSGAQVPSIDIDRAVARKLSFKANPPKHTYEGTLDE